MLFDDLKLEFVDKDITPWGGISLLFKMLSKCKFNEALSSFELPAQGSNRGYSPAQLIEGLFAGVWCGAGCFEHLDTIRYDKTLGTMLGWKRNADHRAYQRYLNKFTQAINSRCFDPKSVIRNHRMRAGKKRTVIKSLSSFNPLRHENVNDQDEGQSNCRLYFPENRPINHFPVFEKNLVRSRRFSRVQKKKFLSTEEDFLEYSRKNS